MKYITTINDQEFTIEINQDNQVTVNGQPVEVDMHQMLDTTMHSLIINGQSYDVRMKEGTGAYVVELKGHLFEVTVADERTRRLAGIKSSFSAGGEAIIKAPMPGVVVEVPVSPGQPVEAGDVVVIFESMKMQNELKAPRTGQVHAVRVSPGDRVDQNAILVTIS
ncbi:MAG: biotin/lipoyl-binding protein [Chloroflexi bacterium]|nr:MAG: biotin/lipoyl-binding protein [Chloroflexota bacterium]